MAQRELTEEQDKIDVLEFRHANKENPQEFKCPKHKEKIKLIAEGTNAPIMLTGCCDKGFDAFLEHVRTVMAWRRVLRNQSDEE